MHIPSSIQHIFIPNTTVSQTPKHSPLPKEIHTLVLTSISQTTLRSSFTLPSPFFLIETSLKTNRFPTSTPNSKPWHEPKPLMSKLHNLW
ncbi:hypothetical protein JAAARDRAFT_215024 [Jaapia argillacea MUCL 33604]|uniref:Uncharacterized protein n=1 Tax=Jaapia argillacea MUCL 33604 TaxID=933084 RepID=A0A067QKL4_9AGAM|nr:hypothetical protein JAAARDRAFT_215024 [Jaapia argillacea MUCL 33604]